MAKNQFDSRNATPLCPYCLAPFTQGQDYCEKCGEAVGKYTPYLPYEGIRFDTGIFKKMWKNIWYDKETRLLSKIFYLFLIGMSAPVMVIGLPFVLWQKFMGKKQRTWNLNNKGKEK